MSGYTMSQMELLYDLPTSITKNTYTTEACISATSINQAKCIIPANYFSQIGKALAFRASGTIAGITTATSTFTFAAALDTVAGTIGGSGGVLIGRTNSVTANVLTAPWDMAFDLTAQTVGASTLLVANGVIRVSNTNSGAFTSSFQAAPFASSLTAINGETSLYLELFGAWQASSASNTHTLMQFKCYGEN